MSERLRKLRKTLDLTQQEFADRIKIARGNISAYEAGKNAMSNAVISLICREFNVSEDWLRYGTGDMFLPEETDGFDSIVKKYGLSEAERLLVEKYITSSDKVRKAIVDFIVSVSKELEAVSEMDVPGEPEDLESENEKSDAG